MRHIGITGSRVGGSAEQLERLKEVLDKAKRVLGYTTLHHGDCEGVDAQADAIAKELGYETICHPPIGSTYRAWTAGHKIVCRPLPFLERNRIIVEEVEVLLAFPSRAAEVLRSGTWATIRYARQARRPTMIVDRYGHIRVEDNQ
jgi:hypothetical protein